MHIERHTLIVVENTYAHRETTKNYLFFAKQLDRKNRLGKKLRFKVPTRKKGKKTI